MTNSRLRYPLRAAGVTVVASVTSVALLAGCSTLPHDTNPQILQTYQPNAEDEPVEGPIDGREADLLLRDFYTASAIPGGDYAAARAFLTPAAAESWDPEGDLLLVDAIDINTVSGTKSADERSFAVRGTVIGKLQEGGSYVPENGAYEAEITLRLVDGQWRIDDLPAGIVIERTELRNHYRPENLYFFGTSGTTLISDRRWVFAGQESLDAELITLLMQGPDSQLDPAVEEVIPHGAMFAGVQDGVYRFTGMSEMNEEDRTRFAAQLVWTLANAGVPGPYQATADGAPLQEGLKFLEPDDFAEFNPRMVTDRVPELYSVANGNIVRVSANDAQPLANALGTGGKVQSADITAEGQVAAVRQTNTGEYQLQLGRADGPLEASVQAKTLSRPTIERAGGAAWVVVDGERVVRVVRSSATGRLVESEVSTSALDRLDGEISVLRLSANGARVAMIVGGRIFVGVVAEGEAGAPRIVNVREIGAELGGTALSLDWQPDGSLVVGTSRPETPVWRLEQDGSSVATLSAGNITAPVVAVTASQDTVYATDAHATVQLALQDPDSEFWREVPGLQGVRSAPIVAN